MNSTRRNILLAAAASFAAVNFSRLARAETEFVEEQWEIGGLDGTFAVPRDDTPGLPSVLIIAGSGPTDRDGNSGPIRASTYKLIAHELAKNGIRSLRYDKRGVGTSAKGVKDETELRFDHYVEDAANCAKALQERSKSKRVVLLGHSEGGMIAIRAASRVDAAGLILLATPGRPPRDVLQQQLLAAKLSSRQREEALSILKRVAAGETVADVPSHLQALFRPSVQPYLHSLLPVDPAAELAKVKVPALIVQGDRDLQVSIADFNFLRTAKPDAKFLQLREANHVFKIAPENPRGNVATYLDPNAPLDPELIPAILEFVRAL